MNTEFLINNYNVSVGRRDKRLKWQIIGLAFNRLGYGAHKDISNIERGAENMSNQTRSHLLTIRKHELSNEAG